LADEKHPQVGWILHFLVGSEKILKKSFFYFDNADI